MVLTSKKAHFWQQHQVSDLPDLLPVNEDEFVFTNKDYDDMFSIMDLQRWWITTASLRRPDLQLATYFLHGGYARRCHQARNIQMGALLDPRHRGEIVRLVWHDSIQPGQELRYHPPTWTT